MSILLRLSLGLLLFTSSAWSQEMTAGQFRKLVAMPGDTNALRAELAGLPFWKDSKCSVTLKYQDGKVFREECMVTAKTIGSNYIVFSMNSQAYKQTLHAIAGYDEKASAIKQWGLFGDTLTEAIVNIDADNKISSATSTYAEFMELSVGWASENELYDRTLAYKNGVLFLTREVKTWPLKPATGKTNANLSVETLPNSR